MDIGYDPSLMQRIFHYAMIAMVWGINQIALESDPKPPRDDGGDVAKECGTGEGMGSSNDVEEVEQSDDESLLRVKEPKEPEGEAVVY